MASAHFCEKTVDDLLRVAIKEILARGQSIQSTKGTNREIMGILLELTNPRARLSRTETKGKPFSCLGELCWYLSGSEELNFIEYYLTIYGKYANGGKILGAYGPRLFSGNCSSQMSNVVSWMKQKHGTRQAVVQIFSPSDLRPYQKDIPCTCSLQFLIREDVLHLFVNMRSNDATRGFTHDVFCFTMLQEIVARQLSVGLGGYKHFVGSLHLYDEQLESARLFIDEGWQPTDQAMRKMPIGDPRPNVSRLLAIEETIRIDGGLEDEYTAGLNSYWADLALLLRIFRLSKEKDHKGIRLIKEKVADPYFKPYIDRLIQTLRKSAK